MAPAPSSTHSDIVLTVNGEKYALSVDHRTTLLDALRERLDLTGTKKGCDQGSAAPAPSSSTDAGPCPASSWPSRRRGARSPPSRAWPTATGCTRCSRPSSTSTATSAATAPGPDLLGRRRAPEHAAGWPSAATDDVRPEAGPPPLTPEEIRERMSGNLCRCGAYVSIVQAVARAAGVDAATDAGAGTDSGEAAA